MHIIFGEAVKEIPDSFTVLELDTFRLVNEDRLVTAYCVVEKISLNEFPLVDANKKLHQNLIKYYRERQWEFCEQAIDTLMGKWNSELDSFYVDLLARIYNLKTLELGPDWQGLIEK